MKPNMPSARKQTFKYLSLCKITQGRFNLHLTKLTKIYKQGQLERVFFCLNSFQKIKKVIIIKISELRTM